MSNEAEYNTQLSNSCQFKMSKYLTILLAIILLCMGDCRASSDCDQDVTLSYMNGDMYMIAKSRYSYSAKPKDCAELYLMGHHESGVYTVWPANRLFDDTSLEVFCDMETSGGGWTVIQRRGNFDNSEDYFDKDWDSYKAGFGDNKKEFWLGNDNIYALTNQKLYSARFDLEDAEKKTAFAEYSTFWIDDENRKYTLHVAGYTGTAGDSLASYHDNQKFSAKDQDYDNHNVKNCAEVYKGAWWYNGCFASKLNGLNPKGKKNVYGIGIHWKTWKGRGESLLASEIKIRPKDYKLPLSY